MTHFVRDTDYGCEMRSRFWLGMIEHRDPAITLPNGKVPVLTDGDLVLFESLTSYATLPLTLGPVTVPLIYVIGFAISVALILAVHWLISRTGFGRDLRGARPTRKPPKRSGSM